MFHRYRAQQGAAGVPGGAGKGLFLPVKERISAKRTIREFWERYPNAEQPLLDWHDQVSTLTWQTPNDVKQTYGNASIINANRVVFNIKGNDYRLITYIDYSFGIVFVLWVGRHNEYDMIDARTIDFKRKTDQ